MHLLFKTPQLLLLFPDKTVSCTQEVMHCTFPATVICVLEVEDCPLVSMSRVRGGSLQKCKVSSIGQSYSTGTVICWICSTRHWTPVTLVIHKNVLIKSSIIVDLYENIFFKFQSAIIAYLIFMHSPGLLAATE